MSKSIWDNNTVKFARESEQKCDRYFEKLVHHTTLFKEVVKNDENSRIDYSFIDKKDHYGVCELKIRSTRITDYDSIMVECDKYNELVKMSNEGKRSIYINWFENSIDKYWVVDINRIKSLNFRKTIVPITNKNLGDKYTYNGERYFIPVALGSYFEYDIDKKKYIKKW